MIQVLERPLLVAPLGIRFWDAARDRQVRAGLRVLARSASGHGPRSLAYRTVSDVYAFRGLPGLVDLEQPLDPPAAPSSPPASEDLVVVVEDAEERFLPIAFGVTLPLPPPPLLPRPSAASPAADPTGVMLFSTPSRRLGPGYGTVSGQLAIAGSEQTAANGSVTAEWTAHALVELEIAGSTPLQSLADERGSFAVPFPYPTPPSLLTSSPPTLPIGGLGDVSWPVSLRVFWNPSTWVDLAATRLPSYPSLLDQPAVDLFQQAPGSPPIASPEWTGDVRYGEPLVARTEGSSFLLVAAPDSSP